jgi:NADP-dependent 3-hydroxy acid dehydrogenase YdfG
MGLLEGKKVIITGASSGIGEATARTFVREGATVAVGARRKEKLDALVGDLGGSAHAFGVDVADREAATAFVNDAGEAMGGVDVLVNNAGVMLLGLVWGADISEWEQMIEVNLLGLLYCTHAALPLMGEGGGGHIVNVSSVAGRTANAGSAVYNMTKFGVQAFSEALRQEGAHANIRVTCLEPGYVETELQGHNKNPMVVERMKEIRDDLGDEGVLRPEDMANALLYAVSQPSHVAVNEILVRPSASTR